MDTDIEVDSRYEKIVDDLLLPWILKLIVDSRYDKIVDNLFLVLSFVDWTFEQIL